MGALDRGPRRPLRPFTVHGKQLRGIEYELPVASAQVKSCVLIAGLLASGTTTVIEPEPSRDHTERLLARAGVRITRDGDRIELTQHDELELGDIHVPGDPSSAAFHIAAAILVKGSRIVITDMSANWTRTGFVRIAERMGAIVIGDLESRARARSRRRAGLRGRVASGPLKATTVEPHEVPLAIDELPLVALLGCFAEGETVVTGAQELRVKESDRIATVVDGLRGLGAHIEATDDGFVVTRQRRPARRHDRGPRRPPPGDARRGRRPRLPRRRRGRRDGGRRGLLPGLRGRPRVIAKRTAKGDSPPLAGHWVQHRHGVVVDSVNVSVFE